MTTVLITGMSGTGKSTVVAELGALGYDAVDLDDPAWSEYVTAPDGDGPEREWMWREDRVRELLAVDHAEPFFVSGCASNQVKFRFDRIVLLTAPVDLTIRRLATRTGNPFGKGAGELARVLADKAKIEPLLRRVASLEVDTSAPLEQVVRAVLDHVARRHR
jgi:dephospho-CoA kinase